MFYKNQLNVYQLCILISQRASAMYVKQRTLIHVVKPYSGPLVYYFDPHAPILVSAYVSHISYNIDRMSVFAGHFSDGVSFNGFSDVQVGNKSPVVIPRTRSGDNSNRCYIVFNQHSSTSVYTLSAYF